MLVCASAEPDDPAGRLKWFEPNWREIIAKPATVLGCEPAEWVTTPRCRLAARQALLQRLSEEAPIQ
jgi:hypothetical protein